jgi:WD40 repeat protein
MGTPFTSILLHSLLMAHALSQALMTRLSGCAHRQHCIRPIQNTHDVTSVTFSPDSAHIVSGSLDKTIRLWDAHTGNIVSGPFKGHTNWVTSVAFSPDGTCIVSGSFDHTIKVWDAHTGNIISGPFEGHTNHVTSIEFSPDSARIISGYDDKITKIWDTQTDDVISNHKIQSPSSFENHSAMKNGWILVPHLELLFWILPSICEGVWRPANTAVISKVSTKLDLTCDS